MNIWTEDNWFATKTAVGVILFAVVLSTFAILVSNYTERQECASLAAQGVTAYVASTPWTDNCIVIDRRITLEK